MKLLLLILLAQHAVISAKAGLVTLATGRVTLNQRQAPLTSHVGEGNELGTGASGRAEILLNPDSYLRMLGGSSVVLESEALDRIVVRLAGGSAIVDAKRIDRNMPIRVRLEGATLAIARDGVYLFEEDRVAVLEGELTVEGPGATAVRKDWTLVRTEDGFRPFRGEGWSGHALVEWNAERTRRLAPRLPVRRRITIPFPG